MEAKAVFYALLLNYSLHPNAKTEIPLELGNDILLPVPEHGVHLELRPRIQL